MPSTSCSGRRNGSRAGTRGQAISASEATRSSPSRDPGFIYRTTERTWIDIPGKFIRILLVGIVGERWTSFLTRDLWWGLAAVAFVLAFFGRQQHAGLVLALCGVLVGVFLRVTRIDTIYPSLWWIVAGALAGALLLWLGPRVRPITPVFFTLLGAALLGVSGHLSAWVDGERGDLNVGPFPRGTPVNLVMNINPEAPLGDLVEAAFRPGARTAANQQGRTVRRQRRRAPRLRGGSGAPLAEGEQVSRLRPRSRALVRRRAFRPARSCGSRRS